MNRYTRFIGQTIAAVLFAVVFFWIIDQMTQQDEHTARMQRINAEMRAMDARMDKAAREICRSELGQGAQVLWTREGELVCRPGVK
jgi:type II secretory pathway component PulM